MFLFLLIITLSLIALTTVHAESPAAPPTYYYFISDLHIGGDGALDHCNFEAELITFLQNIVNGPHPAELIILGDAFGLWELTDVKADMKMQHIAKNHRDLFAQLRETGRLVKITLLPGNHDYDLACLPAYKDQLAEYNICLEPGIHITRNVAGRKMWIEHGNQRDAFNTFPDFGNRHGMPSGYFITAYTVAVAGRNAERGRSPWLNDLESVYPNEEIPFWIWSNYFYKEMTPILRWFLLPFLLLFTISVFVFLGRLLERFGILRTKIFHIKLGERFGLPGRLVDWVLWVNSVVISFLLILAIPAYFLSRDIRASLQRYGIDTSEGLKLDKEERYIAAARSVFERDPSVTLYIYGHTHIPSMRKVGPRHVINTGTWLKRLERAKAHFRLLPDVYVPSYRLNYFTVSQEGNAIRVGYQVISKRTPDDLTLLERLVILGKHKPGVEEIPAVTIIETEGKEIKAGSLNSPDVRWKGSPEQRPGPTARAAQSKGGVPIRWYFDFVKKAPSA
ncbi:MAG: metallophosphoesterase [Desulfobacterales bacterium]|nr:metallophosphoesterase [Desulfobacterales bacterium]